MNHQGKQREGIGRQLGVAVLWWEDIDIASVITASGPTPTHMCRPHCGPGTPCDTHILWGKDMPQTFIKQHMYCNPHLLSKALKGYPKVD